MKRLQEKVKVMMNSTYSSLLDFGLTNSQFADLSSVSEDEVEENKGTQYQNLGAVLQKDRSIDRSEGGECRGFATQRNDRKIGGRRTIVVAKKTQEVKTNSRKRYPVASPFELAPKSKQVPQKDMDQENEDIILLNGQNDPISKCVQHYFIDKKHNPTTKKEQKKNTFGLLGATMASPKKPEMHLNTSAVRLENRLNESVRRLTQTAKNRQKYSNRSPSYRSPMKNTDRSMISDQKSQDSNITIVQIQKMRDLSSYYDSRDNSIINDQDRFQTNSIYSLTLCVNYQTQFGQEIAVIGSIPQLGAWDTSRAFRMKWTEGHNWVAERILINEHQGDPSHFMYKYALLKKGKFQFFEKGFNRIADLKLLQASQFDNQMQPVSNQNTQILYQEKGFVYDSYPQGGNFSGYNVVKKVQINDCWEYYQVNFQIFNPLIDYKQKILINGDHSEIGNWSENGPKNMDKKKYRSNWLMKEKYGQKVKFSSFLCKFQNNSQNLPVKMRYSYSKRLSNGDIEWEREPCRFMEIQDPSLYQGQLHVNRKNTWLNCSKVWVVNGEINKVDSNFRVQFLFSKIGRTNLYVGNCPITKDDVMQLSNYGITAVLNLEQNTENFERMRQLYRDCDITTYEQCPIPEFNQIDQLSDRLIQAARILDTIRKRKPHQKILVHCSAGITRSPTLVILYLCLYCQVDFWKQPVEVYQLVKDSHNISFPNMRVIFKVVSRNRGLQYQNCLLLQDEFQKRAASEQRKQEALRQQAEQMQQKLENLQTQLADRLKKRKIERKIRLNKFKRDTHDVTKQQKQIEIHLQKLRNIRHLQEESVDALNRTNEMMQQNIQDQSIILDEVSDYKADMRNYTSRIRKSIHVTKANKNVTPSPLSKKKYSRKLQGSNKKNKSCTPTRLSTNHQSRKSIPVSRLNIPKQFENNLAKIRSENEDGAAGEISKEQSQNDNSFINILQKSQIMTSDIGSKELECIEPGTKSFFDVHNKSDISGNNRSVKFRASIFNNQSGLVFQEHSPIRAQQKQICTNVFLQEEDGNQEHLEHLPNIDHNMEVTRSPRNCEEQTQRVWLRSSNPMQTLPNTAAVSHEFQEEKRGWYNLDRAPAPKDIQCSPVFEYDSLEDEEDTAKRLDEGQIEAAQQSLTPDVPFKYADTLPEGVSRQQVDSLPNQETIQNIKSTFNLSSPQKTEFDQKNQKDLQLQLFKKAVEMSNQYKSDRDENCLDDRKEPVTPYLCKPSDVQDLADASPSIRAYNFLKETLGSIRNTQNKVKMMNTKMDLEDQGNVIDEVNMGSPLFKQALCGKQVRKSEEESAQIKYNLQKIEYDKFENDNFKEQIDLIDQIQKRSNYINSQIKEQIKQKKEQRENSVEVNANRRSGVSPSIGSPGHLGYQNHEVSSNPLTQKRSRSPSPYHNQLNNTSQMDQHNTEVISEARELLNQNKQDLSVLRDNSGQKYAVGSFLSQNANSGQDRADLGRFRDSFRSGSPQNRNTAQNMEKESQFKIDAKLPQDDFDKIKQEIKFQRRLNTLGISKEEVQEKCKQLFNYDMPPIPFISRPNVQVEQKIDQILSHLQSSLPILNVRGSTYLIGIYKFDIRLEGEQVVMKNQEGKYVDFKEYLTQNQDYIQQMLVVQTLLCKQNLSYVINSHMIDQCIPELQRFEDEQEEETGTQVSARYPYRASNIYKMTNQNTPIGTNCTMTPNKREYNQVVIEDIPDDLYEVQKVVKKSDTKLPQTIQCSPHSRNQSESIQGFNSTPLKKQVKLNKQQEDYDTKLINFRPKVQSVSYNQKVQGKQKAPRKNKKERHTTGSSHLNSQKAAASRTSFRFDSINVNSRVSGDRITLKDKHQSIPSNRSSKKMSISQIQIKQAKEKVSKRKTMESHRNDLTSADTINEFQGVAQSQQRRESRY